eukprot:COSAG02_NODE_451_length_22060_cov_6.853513_5_plen_960_part_00
MQPGLMLISVCLAAGNAFASLTPRGSPPLVSELQGATSLRNRHNSGGDLVWVLGSNLVEPCVRIALMNGEPDEGSGNCLSIESRVNDSLLLVNVGSLPSTGPRRLQVNTAAGTALTPPVNAPELDWVEPYGRPGATVAVVGRRLANHNPSIVLSCHGFPNIYVAAFVESDTRATFELPINTAPGICKTAWKDDWGVWPGSTSGGPVAATQMLVLSPMIHAGSTDANEAPYYADSSGKTDATDSILAAIAATPENGTVKLAAGTYRINPPTNTSFPQSPGCVSMTAALCTGRKHVTIVGAGQSKTVILQGNRAEVAIWGSAISLRNLTLSDALPADCYNETNGAPLESCLNITRRYDSPALWSMNTWGAFQFNVSDISFVNVHFIATRAATGLHLRYCRRCTIQNCLIDGGAIELAGPVQDVRILNNTARLHGPFPTKLGGGVGAFVMAGVGGRISTLVVANNTLEALLPIEQSTISGRIIAFQANVEHLYVSDNLNKRAGPGDQCPDMNQGEQVLWETGNEGRVPDDHNATVINVEGSKLTVRFGLPTTVPYLVSKIRPSLSDRSGGMVGAGWRADYAHAGSAFFGGVTVLWGKGVGQTRMITDLSNDNMTLTLDSEFGISPDTESAIVVWGSCVHQIVMRDNLFYGISKHVEQEAHTATVMIPLWGRAHRATYTNNIGQDMRVTMYSMVNGRVESGGGGSLSVTDHIVRDVVSTHTRTGLDIQPSPHQNRLTIIATMLNITLRDVVDVAVGISPSGAASDPASGTTGGLAIMDVEVYNASTGFASYRPGSNPAMPWQSYSSEYNGTGIGALLVQNASFAGPGAMGSIIAQPLSVARFSTVSFTGFNSVNNGTVQPVTPYVLTPRVLPAASTISMVGDDVSSTEWVVWFENSGMGKGTVILSQLDDGLKANATSWVVGPASGALAIGISGVNHEVVGGCGTISCGAMSATFCCVKPLLA